MSTALAPYEELLAHVELELELAGRGELDALTELAPRFGALTAALPEQRPPGARELIERAALVHERAQIELLRLRELVLADLATLRRARAAARGYGAGAPAAPGLRRSA